MKIMIKLKIWKLNFDSTRHLGKTVTSRYCTKISAISTRPKELIKSNCLAEWASAS